MIGSKGDNQASELLSTLIGTIVEDTVDLALSVGRQRWTQRRLLRAGQDITTLAMAMEIVQRRTRRRR